MASRAIFADKSRDCRAHCCFEAHVTFETRSRSYFRWHYVMRWKCARRCWNGTSHVRAADVSKRILHMCFRANNWLYLKDASFRLVNVGRLHAIYTGMLLHFAPPVYLSVLTLTRRPERPCSYTYGPRLGVFGPDDQVRMPADGTQRVCLSNAEHPNNQQQSRKRRRLVNYTLRGHQVDRDS